MSQVTTIKTRPLVLMRHQLLKLKKHSTKLIKRKGKQQSLWQRLYSENEDNEVYLLGYN